MYFRKNPQDENLSVEEILAQLNNNKTPAFVKRLQRFNSNIIGSPGWFKAKNKVLEHGMEQLGPGTYFLTFSYADVWWPELHRLLGTEKAKKSVRCKAIQDNPHIVTYFFVKKVEAWNRLFGDVLQFDWEWVRYENQHRGTVHMHMIVQSKSDPNMTKLSEAIKLGRNHRSEYLKAMRQNVHSPDYIAKLKAKVDAGDQAERDMIAYCDFLVTYQNPKGEEERETYRFADDHPSARVWAAIPLDDRDEDYGDLVNAVQLHLPHKCSSYCQRYDEFGKPYCKFGFPKDLCDETNVKEKVKKDGTIDLEIEYKRNCPLVNKHIRFQLHSWRANVDATIILHWRACLAYISKYANKVAKRSDQLNDLMKKICAKHNDSTGQASLFRKLGIAVIGLADRSHQETIQILLAPEMPIITHKNWEIINQNLFDECNVIWNGEKFVEKPNNLMSYYALFLHECPEKKDINFYHFVLKKSYTKRGGFKDRKAKHGKHFVINWTPKLYCAPNKWTKFIQFLKFELIKYRPWKIKKENAWLDAQKIVVEENLEDCIANCITWPEFQTLSPHNDLSTETSRISIEQLFVLYNSLMQSTYAKRKETQSNRTYIPWVVTEQVKFSKIKIEEDEVRREASPEVQGDLFAAFEADMINDPEEADITDSNDSHDWNLDFQSFGQHKQNMLEQIKGLKLNEVQEFIELERPLDCLHSGQKHVLDIITEHYTSKSEEQLLLGIFGEPGTGKGICINVIHHLTQHHAMTMGPTGKVAFMNHGKTLHDALKLPCPLRGEPNFGIEKNKKSLELLQARFKGVKYIVIDEVSMIGQRMLGWLDVRLKSASCQKDKPFGGFNVIIVGDFGQLSPIGDTPLWKQPTRSKGFVEGHILYKEFKKIVVLSNENNMRQKGSAHSQVQFRQFLRRLRDGKCVSNDYKFICNRMVGNISSEEMKKFDDATRIFARKKPARKYNEKKLKEMQLPIARINAVHDLSVARQADSDRAGGLRRVLYLSKDALVTLTTNIYTKIGLTNGTSGKVVAIMYKPDTKPPGLPICVVVQFPHLIGRANFVSCIPHIPGCVAITPITREWRSANKKYTRTQLPVRLGWAMTIHQSQGQTLDRVVITTDQATFAPGMLYVALSRVRSSSDLIIDQFEESYLTTRLAGNETISFRINEESRLTVLYHNTMKEFYSRHPNLREDVNHDESYMSLDEDESEDDDMEIN